MVAFNGETLAQKPAEENWAGKTASAVHRWCLEGSNATRWTIEGTKLPHKDFIEQGGRRVGQVVRYAVDKNGILSVDRSVIWPSLRIFPNNTHGSFIRAYGNEATPVLSVDQQPLGPMKLKAVVLDGTLTFIGAAGGLDIQRITFPALEKYTAVDRWVLTNTSTKAVAIAVAPMQLKSEQVGPYGVNIAEVTTDAPSQTSLEPSKTLSFSVYLSARLAGDAAVDVDGAVEEKERRGFIQSLNSALQLETPDPVLNRAFTFAKWRVAEAMNDTRGGLMLAPGNLRYYAATWCNDNVEYAGPLFPFLGDKAGIAGSLNAYRQYIKYMTPEYKRIPCSVIAEGTDTWGGIDRGDAAMYAYGASRFSLALGDKAVAEELWKGIEWTLEYCNQKLTPAGVVPSTTDELEGRLPAGNANLSTSCLYYGGLRSAAHLAIALGKPEVAVDLNARADTLAKAIENFFGATVENFNTYRYYEPGIPSFSEPKPDPNAPMVLRSWICMPLAMGIFDRKQGTIDALFSPQMWTPDGLASRSGDKVFWDRSTLYAFRAVFQAGETTKALDFLRQYTNRRLLDDHVPYAVEACPEGGMAHLSSESGLYCRIFTEGMFGILPTGLDRFEMSPRLPEEWPSMALRHVKLFGRDFDVEVKRNGQQLDVQVVQNHKIVQKQTLQANGKVTVVLTKL